MAENDLYEELPDDCPPKEARDKPGHVSRWHRANFDPVPLDLPVT